MFDNNSSNGFCHYNNHNVHDDFSTCYLAFLANRRIFAESLHFVSLTYTILLREGIVVNTN